MPLVAQLAESQWLAQLAAMRQSLADLKLHKVGDSMSYGQDLLLEDDGFSSALESVDDLWDIISEDDNDDRTSDESESIASASVDGKEIAEPKGLYNLQWLARKCQAVAERNVSLNPSELQQQLISVLAADIPPGELQISLTEIVGFDDLDFVIVVVNLLCTMECSLLYMMAILLPPSV
ncbi:hypothetical protein ACJ72_05583 [Emergomyces africanus]|uniref:Uncharacterized protein n=1 Tax=Emergomyces africanus TaxID=1955775 RepID=A0A1B7NTL4_9EURO|nr:hypothetical protein ACJ72_05583 [Emergomyces africanus]